MYFPERLLDAIPDQHYVRLLKEIGEIRIQNDLNFQNSHFLCLEKNIDCGNFQCHEDLIADNLQDALARLEVRVDDGPRDVEKATTEVRLEDHAEDDPREAQKVAVKLGRYDADDPREARQAGAAKFERYTAGDQRGAQHAEARRKDLAQL